MTLVTVVLTTFNKLENLRMSLASLENQTDREFEINILDDGSTDGTKEFCMDYVSTAEIPCRYIRVERPGYNLSRTRNLGIEHARGDYILFLDNDIVIVPQFLAQYKDHFDQEPDKIHLGRLLYVKTDHLPKISLAMVEAGDFTEIEAGLHSPQDPRVEVFHHLPDHYKVWGGNMGIKRKTLCSINGFDEDFTAWGGLDTDIGLRLIRSGYTIVLHDDCTGYHFGTEFKTMEEIQKEPGVRLFEDHKQYDLNPVRNKRTKKEGKTTITIFYNGMNFPTDLSED